MLKAGSPVAAPSAGEMSNGVDPKIGADLDEVPPAYVEVVRVLNVDADKSATNTAVYNSSPNNCVANAGRRRTGKS